MRTKGIKIKKSIDYTLLHIALACFALSCNESQDEVFEYPATQRAAMQIETLRDELIGAKEGWKVAYSPDSAELGVFTFLIKFNDDGKTVDMVSDFDSLVRPPTRGEYELILGSSVKLSFTTRNEIHKLSDSANPPSLDFDNKGYKGDFEFLYYGKQGEDLLFKGNRSYVEVRFKKATARDWQDMDAIKQVVKKLTPSLDVPFGMAPMLSMQVQSAVGSEKYYRTSPLTTRKLQWEGGSVVEEEKSFRILSITPSGFITSPLVIGEGESGVKLSEFAYDASQDAFVAARDGAAAVIRLLDESAPSNVEFGSRDDNIGLDNFLYVIGDEYDDSRQAPATSDEFVTLVKQAANQVKEITNEGLGRFYIRLNREFEGNVYHYIAYRLYDSLGDYQYVNHYFTYEFVNERIQMTPSFWTFPDGTDGTEEEKYKEALKPVDDFFMTGTLYFLETPRFTRYSNRVFAFRNDNHPSVVAGGFYSF